MKTLCASMTVLLLGVIGVSAAGADIPAQELADMHSGTIYQCRYKANGTWEHWEGIPNDQSVEGARKSCDKSVEKYGGSLDEKCQDCALKPSVDVSMSAGWNCRGQGRTPNGPNKEFRTTVMRADTETQALGLFVTWWDYASDGPKKRTPPYELISDTANCRKYESK